MITENINKLRFLIGYMFVVKLFQKPECLGWTKFRNATFQSSMNDWHYISFYARCYFFMFQFPHVFRKFSAVNILFVAKISCVVSETIFKWSFCNAEIFLIWFTGCCCRIGKNWLLPTEMYCWTITNRCNKITGYK